jgi:hypothetical protein
MIVGECKRHGLKQYYPQYKFCCDCGCALEEKNAPLCDCGTYVIFGRFCVNCGKKVKS